MTGNRTYAEVAQGWVKPAPVAPVEAVEPVAEAAPLPKPKHPSLRLYTLETSKDRRDWLRKRAGWPVKES